MYSPKSTARTSGGGDDLASGTFNSGSGSTNEKIVTPYIKRVREWLHSVNSNSKVIVDLGCGDFRVGQQYADMALRYIGVDIVKDLVIYNRTIYGNERVEFHHLNIIEEELPDGDICFIRQVLQHLSNNQITAILPKPKKYQWVIVTEHQPTGECPHPNLDKPHGGDIRVFRNSGVYLDRPPFSIPRQKISLLLEIEGHGFSNGIDPGVIRTFVVTP